MTCASVIVFDIVYSSNRFFVHWTWVDMLLYFYEDSVGFPTAELNYYNFYSTDDVIIL